MLLRTELNNDLLKNLEKLHTTELGLVRVKRNLNLDCEDVVSLCREKIKIATKVVKNGKNWYVYVDDNIITVNSHSYTIITAHKWKK